MNAQEPLEWFPLVRCISPRYRNQPPSPFSDGHCFPAVVVFCRASLCVCEATECFLSWFHALFDSPQVAEVLRRLTSAKPRSRLSSRFLYNRILPLGVREVLLHLPVFLDLILMHGCARLGYASELHGGGNGAPPRARLFRWPAGRLPIRSLFHLICVVCF